MYVVIVRRCRGRLKGVITEKHLLFVKWQGESCLVRIIGNILKASKKLWNITFIFQVFSNHNLAIKKTHFSKLHIHKFGNFPKQKELLNLFILLKNLTIYSDFKSVIKKRWSRNYKSSLCVAQVIKNELLLFNVQVVHVIQFECLSLKTLKDHLWLIYSW